MKWPPTMPTGARLRVAAAPAVSRLRLPGHALWPVASLSHGSIGPSHGWRVSVMASKGGSHPKTTAGPRRKPTSPASANNAAASCGGGGEPADARCAGAEFDSLLKLDGPHDHLVAGARAAMRMLRPPVLPEPVVPTNSACRRRKETRHWSASSNGPGPSGSPTTACRPPLCAGTRPEGSGTRPDSDQSHGAPARTISRTLSRLQTAEVLPMVNVRPGMNARFRCPAVGRSRSRAPHPSHPAEWTMRGRGCRILSGCGG